MATLISVIREKTFVSFNVTDHIVSCGVTDYSAFLQDAEGVKLRHYFMEQDIIYDTQEELLDNQDVLTKCPCVDKESFNQFIEGTDDEGIEALIDVTRDMVEGRPVIKEDLKQLFIQLRDNLNSLLS